ncbi:MAG: hypothetical protein IJU72_08960 [Bacteroidales bacterium]|nr:hypothetical protein [Bacteroidales bacterium]
MLTFAPPAPAAGTTILVSPSTISPQLWATLPLVLLSCAKAAVAAARFAMGLPQRGHVAGLRRRLGTVGLLLAYAGAVGLGMLVVWAAPFPLAMAYHACGLMAGLLAAVDGAGSVLRGLLWWPLMPFCWRS